MIEKRSGGPGFAEEFLGEPLLSAPQRSTFIHRGRVLLFWENPLIAKLLAITRDSRKNPLPFRSLTE
ncbi:hypothetical protein [Nocardia higoensis]|uniref:hypothetical protein n=1 Tax=Nocardia higoensis TaxID=228599 RepID=UPI0002F70EF5|nr:hypothetical protein [Nocardia higoensis]